MRNPLSIEAFADWCEKQPADKEYVYEDSWHCACAQYADSLGIANSEDSLPAWRLACRRLGSFWWRADDIASKDGHTFGELAKRLREAA